MLARQSAIRTLAAVSLGLCVLAVGHGVAGGASPSALILERTGPSTPAVNPYSEVMAGDTVKLGPAAKLGFIDYFSCTNVTVDGEATVKFGGQGFSIEGPAKYAAQRVDCPHEVTLRHAGEASAGVMRGRATEVVALSTRPDFLLVGRGAARIRTIRISRDNTKVWEGEVRSSHFTWPAKADALAGGAIYQMDLLGRPKAAPFRVAFRAADAPKRMGPVLIRIE